MAVHNGKRVLKDSSGKLYKVDPSAADNTAKAKGWTDASDEEVQARASVLAETAQHGDLGSQAQALGEKTLRTATFGMLGPQGSDEKARARTLDRESPVLSFAAQAAGAALPGLATAGAASALGAGGALAAGAEGIATGLAEETENSMLEGRPISAGNVLLFGLGGELAGRAVPGLIRRGIRGLAPGTDAVARLAGEAAEDLAVSSEQKAMGRAARAAADMPEGPARAKAMAQTADEQFERASAEMADSIDQGTKLQGKVEKALDDNLDDLVAPDAPAQTVWATDTARALRAVADQFPDDPRGIVSKSGRRAGTADWKGSPKAAASVDARIEAYGEKEEFQELVRSKAAETRRTPFGPGKERELWELQKDVLEENPKLFPRVKTAPTRAVREGKLVDMYGDAKPDQRSLSEAAHVAETLGVGKSIEDLGALPIEAGDNGVARLKGYDYFKSTGNVQDKFGSSRGGLPQFTLEDGRLLMSNGRHRWTAAQESGMTHIVGHIRKFDKNGDELWNYVGPVRVHPDAPAGKSLSAGASTAAAFEPITPRAFISKGKAFVRDIEADPSLQKVVDEYTGGGYRGINRLLRRVESRNVANDEYWAGKAKELQAALDAQVAKGHNTPGVVYRQADGANYSSLKPGDTFTDTGFMSTSQHMHGAQSLEEVSTPITFEVRQQTGVPIFRRASKYSKQIHKEREILMRPGTRFRVVGEKTFERPGMNRGPERMVTIEEVLDDAAPGKVAPAPARSTPITGSNAGSALRKLADDLLSTNGSAKLFSRTRSGIRELEAAGAPPEALKQLRDGLKMKELWGKAAEVETDFQTVGSKMASAQKAIGAVDKDSLRAALSAEPTARGGAGVGMGQLIESLEDAAAIASKYGLLPKGPLGKMLSVAMRAKRAVANADSVFAGRAAAPASSGIAAEVVETAADMAMGAMGVPPVAGLAYKVGKRVWKNIDDGAKAAIKDSARRMVRPLYSESLDSPKAMLATSALSRFRAEYSSPEQAYQARVKMLDTLRINPSVLPMAIAQSTGTMSREDPELFSQVAGRIQSQFAYVSANLPVSIGVSLAYPRGVPTSRQALRDFSVLWNSTFQPETVLDDFAKGEATPAQMRVLSDVHPDLHSDLQQQTMFEAANSFASIPTQRKQQLDILFGTDGIAGPSFSWRASDYIEEANDAAMQRGGAGSQAPASSPAQEGYEPAGLNAIRSGVTNRGA